MTTDENVHGEVSDISEDSQAVEDKCNGESGDDRPKVGSYCNADSHAMEKEEVLFDNGGGKNDADNSYVFVSGTEAVAADDDPSESDLNVTGSHKKSNRGENVPYLAVDPNGTYAASEGLQGELSSGVTGENNNPTENDKFDGHGQQFVVELEVDEQIEVQPLPESQVMVSEAAEYERESQQLHNKVKNCTDGSVVSPRSAEENWGTQINDTICTICPESNHHVDGENVGLESEPASELQNVVVAVEKELSEYVGNDVRKSESISVTDMKESKEFNNLVGANIQISSGEENGANKYIENVGRGSEPVKESQQFNSIAWADAENNLANKSNSGKNVPCFAVNSNGTCAASEALQDELKSGVTRENENPTEHDKFDGYGQQFVVELKVDEQIEVQPLPESQVMVSEAAECECERQQLHNQAKNCTDCSVVSPRPVEEIWETKINGTICLESNHHVDEQNVGLESEPASELKNVVVVVEKELSEYVGNVVPKSESISVTNMEESKEFNNLVVADIQISSEEENGANKYIENVGRGSEPVKKSQQFNNIARTDAQNNLASKRDLSEYVDEIPTEGKPGSGGERREEDSEQGLTTDSCFVADMKIGTVFINGTISNGNRNGSVTGYIQDRVSTAVDSYQIAGEHNIPFEITESDLGSADSNQVTSQQNGLTESPKTSPFPASGENTSIENNECHPCASTGTECGKLGTKRSEMTDSFLVYDTKLEIEPDNDLLLDKPTLPSDHTIINAGTSSVNNNASGGNLDHGAETKVGSLVNSLTENGSNLQTCSVEDVELAANLSALGSTDTPGDGNVIPSMNGDAVKSAGAPSVDISVKKEENQFTSYDDTQEVKVASDIHGGKDSRPTKEGSTVVLDGQNMGAEVGKKPFYFLIRLPRYDDDKNIKEEIKYAQFQVDDKTKSRDAIRVEIQIKKATLNEYVEDVEAAISAERAARDLLKSKRQEMDSVQSMVNRLNNAISVEDIDVRIRNMEHMIEHETLPLKEEKHLLRQIKQLKQHREELSFNLGKQDQLWQSLDHKDSIEDHFKRLQLLRKEVESLKHNVQKEETVSKAAKKKYHDECNKLSELLAQFKASDDIRQEAYAKLQALKRQLYEKSKNFWDYKNAANKANELAAGGKREELQCFCVNQVESIMQLWNKNDEFRREYVRCNTRSTLRRLRTLDGRSLGPDEEPPVIPNVVNERASKINSLPLHSTLEQEKKAVSAETVNLEDEPISKVLVQRSLPTKTRNSAKSALLEKSFVMVSNWDEAEDVREEPMRTKEEEELILKAEEVRKEEDAAKLKEKRRLEEMAKAKEAMQRKKRHADKAQQRAALRAQKEAEQKEKEREKKARKKERRKAAAIETVVNTGEPVPSSEALSRMTDEFDSEKSVEVTKRLPKPSQLIKQTKAKSIPLPLRNRGKRRMQPYMWVLITILVVVALFFLGNKTFHLRSGLQGFGF